MKKLVCAFVVLLAVDSWGLVISPTGVNFDGYLIEYKLIQERGKIEPNENPNSFQDAKIDINQFSVTKGLHGLVTKGKDHYLRIDYKDFKSGQEQVSGQLFYEQDRGQNLMLTLGMNFVHELQYKAGIYMAYSPLVDFNEEKFSVPRVDLWQLGLTSAVQLSDEWFMENQLHYGSGIDNKQNGYIVLNQLVGYKFDSAFDLPLLFKYGPYLESDTEQRQDKKYDAAFFPSGPSDRVRSMKYGVNMHISYTLNQKYVLAIGEVQKLGGYDAVATRAYYFSLAGVF